MAGTTVFAVIMKQLIILFTFLITSINADCDTIDYWAVYINDTLVAEFNANSEDLSMTLKKAELKNTDTITVRYGTCVHCVDCHSRLTVFAEIKQKLPEAETKEYFGKLSISINDLLELDERYDLNTFSFYYADMTIRNIDRKERLLFVLRFI